MFKTNATRVWKALLRRQLCLVPTCRGWILIFGAGTLLLIFTARNAHSFLAISDPLLGGGLVVEGWAPDYALAEAIAECKRGSYVKLFVTGGPLDQGTYLSEYKTYAELGAATLVHMGLCPDLIQAVPTPGMRQDRTFTAALALKQWLDDQGSGITRLNVISLGAHSRRSRLLFQKAFGTSCRVGIMSIEDQRYDAKRWWNSSVGFKLVIDEAIAYGYTKFWFLPHEL